MIRPQELRLDNWILGKARRPIKVAVVRGWLLDAETEFGFKTVEIKNTDPIPLNDDILERAGFVYSTEKLLWTLTTRKCTLVINDDYHPVINDVCSAGRLNVHRLQNLYEALTCEDLNINFF